MSILDKVPDIIKEAAVQAGVPIDATATAGTKAQSTWYPPELVDAFKKGDYNTIQQYTDKATNDLAPIWDNIRVHGKQAFIEVINKSDGVRYQLSPAGRNGWVWVYTKPNGPSGPIESDTLGDQPSFDHVVQLGSFSANSKTLGISDQLWSNTTLQLAAGAVSAIFMMTFSSFIKSRIGGAAVEAAAEAAVAEGGAEAAAAGLVTAGSWAGLAATVGSMLAGAVVGAIAFLLIMYIANFVDRIYKIAVNIYNWDTHNFAVVEWYGNNANVDGDQQFVPFILPAPTTNVPLPTGFAPSTGASLVSYATMIFTNNNKIFEGLGVAIRVKSADGSAGFALKYDVRRFADNRLGLGSGFTEDLRSFWNDQMYWAKVGDMGTAIQLNTINRNLKIPISCTTTSLGGRDDQLYQLDVHIGLQNTGDNPPNLGDTRPTKSLLDAFEPAPLLSTGDNVTLPDGSVVQVTGTNKTSSSRSNKGILVTNGTPASSGDTIT